MKSLGIKAALFINYFVFAILLNSVGIVILKAQENYGVDEVQASVLEIFKDLPIAFVSLIIASFLPRIGYKKAMLTGIGLVTLGCIAMYFGNSFTYAKILFATVGVSFALIKVSVYSMVGLVTNSQKEHNGLMSQIEGFFMFGIALAYFLFPAFNMENNPDSWLNVYWVLAGLSIAAFVFLLLIPYEEQGEIPGANIREDILEMGRLITKMLVIVFVISAFLFVMIEQGIMTWLPTFNDRVLNFSETIDDATQQNISIRMASILAISLGVGRIIAGIIAKRIEWIWVLSACILLAMGTVAFVLPMVTSGEAAIINSFTDIPLAAYTFPLVGLFIAPIYPMLNSVVLSALPKRLHSPMTGWIVIFSALGGTFGSRIIGYLFKTVGADTAFLYTLFPLTVLLVALFILRKLTIQENAKNSSVA